MRLYDSSSSFTLMLRLYKSAYQSWCWRTCSVFEYLQVVTVFHYVLPIAGFCHKIGLILHPIRFTSTHLFTCIRRYNCMIWYHERVYFREGLCPWRAMSGWGFVNHSRLAWLVLLCFSSAAILKKIISTFFCISSCFESLPTQKIYKIL